MGDCCDESGGDGGVDDGDDENSCHDGKDDRRSRCGLGDRRRPSTLQMSGLNELKWVVSCEGALKVEKERPLLKGQQCDF